MTEVSSASSERDDTSVPLAAFAISGGGQRQAVVELRAVSVSYGSNRVLTDIDLSFAAGRITALLGANGAGKSTLIRALSGANPRYKGTISISGEPVVLSSPAVARHVGISAVHQKIADGIVPGLTVAENVLLDELAGGRRSPLRHRRRDLDDARSALALLGLDWSDRVLNQDARDLRISDAQLLILARALRSTPKLLILDEPTSALTAAEVDRLFAVLERLRAGGLAIIYVSHRFGEVETLADSVVVLRDGRVLSVCNRPFDWNEILHDMLGEPTDLSQARDSNVRGTVHVARVDGVKLFATANPMSLDIRGGEVLGVLGLIGAGKTELAGSLAGVTAPLSGSMILGGSVYAPSRPGDAIREGVVLVPEDRQQQGILPGWSVARNITVPFLRESSVWGNLLGVRERARATSVVDALDVVTQSLDTSIDELSGGNQQKVVVGRWLSASPRLALLDEPFRGVDIAARRIIGARLSSLATSGAAAVVFSSDVDEILEVSDRVVVLVSGEIALDSYADEVDRSTLIAAFLGNSPTTGPPHRNPDSMSTQTTKRQGQPRPSLTERSAAGIVRWGFVSVTIALIAYFAITEPNFRTVDNVFGMLKFVAPTAIAGLGVMLAMTVGGIDLSVGASAGFAVSIAAWTMVIGNQVGGVAVVVVLVCGVLIGGLNALLIVVARIPDLLATLTTMFVIVGLKLLIVDGRSISSQMSLDDGSTAPGRFTPDFLAIDRGSISHVPIPVIIFLAITVLLWFLLERTRWGRALYAVGANAEAARLAGIRVTLYRMGAYMGCGLLASIAGLLLGARIGQGDVTAGNSLLLDAVAVALVGVSVLGVGRPNAWGTALGAVLIAVMVTGFTMAGLPYYAQDFGKGIVLLVALLFSFTFSRRRTIVVAGAMAN